MCYVVVDSYCLYFLFSFCFVVLLSCYNDYIIGSKIDSIFCTILKLLYLEKDTTKNCNKVPMIENRIKKYKKLNRYKLNYD